MEREDLRVRTHRLVFAIFVCVVCVRTAGAQQRPLLTEDPEVLGTGNVLVEAGIDGARDQHYTVSGLQGNLWRLPTLGVSVGISPIAEIQIDGGFLNRLGITDRNSAPLSHLVTATGDHASDVEDIVIGAKIRLLGEGASRPSLGFRFATRLPNATNESGLGHDTTDFHASLLGAKTIQSVRAVANIGVGILGDPVNGHQQNDVLTYGASVARALTNRWEVVSELNGRVSVRETTIVGTETRGRLGFGTRYTRGPVRVDAGLFFGLTSVDPTVGFTTGFTYVFHAFDLK